MNNEVYTTVIKLNAEEAQNNLKKLEDKISELKKKKEEAFSNGKTAIGESIAKDLNKAQREMKAFANSTMNTKEVLDNLGKANLGQLEKAAKDLRREFKATSDPEQLTKLQEKIDAVAARMDRLKNKTEDVHDIARKLSSTLSNIPDASASDLLYTKSHLQTQMNGLNPNSDMYKQQSLQLREVDNQLNLIKAKQEQNNTLMAQYDREVSKARVDMEDVKNETQLVNNTLSHMSTASVRDLEYSIKILNNQMRGLNRGTKEFKAMEEQAKKLKTELQNIRYEGGAQQSWMNRTADWFNKMQGLAISVFATVTGLLYSMRQSVQMYLDMDKETTNVRKYTGQTTEQVAQMNEEFKKMNTATAREQLNKFAEDAGRLGLSSTKAVEEFVDAADKISVAVGDDLGEGAVDTIAKMAQAFGEDKRLGLRGAMLATGSALNELSQSSTASAGYIVDFTARLSGMGLQAKISQQDIMGFGAVLDQNMQEAETSATALGQLITKMYQDPAKFAKLAGKNVADFTKLLKTDANKALLEFFNAMKNRGGFAQLAPMFEGMQLNGNRAVGVLSTMAAKLNDVTIAQSIANKAYNDGTSVLREFDLQNNSQAAQLEKAKKNFQEIAITLGKELLPISRTVLTTGSMTLRGLKVLIDFVIKYKTTIMTLTAGIAALIIVEEADVIKKKAIVLWNDVLIKGSKKLWATLAAHPYIAIAAAVATLIALMADLLSKTDAVQKGQEDLNKIREKAAEQVVDEKIKIENLVSIARDETKSLTDRHKAIDELNKIVPNYNAKLQDTTNKYSENKGALDSYISSLIRLYEIQGAKEKISELSKQKADLVIKEKEIQKTLQQMKATPGVTYTTSWGTVSNTTTDSYHHFSQQLEEVQSDIKDTKTEINTITDVYGEDIKKTYIPPKGDGGGGGNGNNYGNDAAEEKARKAREAAERKREAARKKRLNNELKAAKDETDMLQAQNMLAYEKGEETQRERIEKQHQIAIDGYNKRINIYKKYKEDYRQLEDDKAKEELEKENSHNKFLQADIEANYQKDTALAKAEYSNRDSAVYHDQAVLNERLFEADMSYMADKLAAMKDNSEEWLELSAEMQQRELEHKSDKEEYYNEMLSQYREDWGKKDIKLQEKIALDGLDHLHEVGLLKEAEYQDMRKKIQLEYALQESENNLQNSKGVVNRKEVDLAYQIAHNNAEAGVEDKNEKGTKIGNYLTSDVKIFAATWKNIKEMEKNGVLSHEQAMAAMSKATGNFAENFAAKMQAAYDSVSTLTNSLSSYYSSQSDYEVAVTEKKYEKMISAAGNNTQKTKKLEEQKEKEVAKIKTKYAHKQASMQVAQAIAQTAISAIAAYGSAMSGVPYPANLVLAPVAAGIALAAGALQIATIKKQQQAQDAGYYEGGYTSSGRDWHKKAGIVHENEFVANHVAVNNPNVRPFLNYIDKAQRNNTIGGLTALDVSRAMGSNTTVVSAPVVNVDNNNSELQQQLNESHEVISKLTAVLAAGIHAKVFIAGDDGVKKNLEIYDNLMSNK